jgi:ketosteroid isomerase-like protein
MKTYLLLSFSILFCFFTACKGPAPRIDHLNELMDNWHQAAAEADEEVFFNSMSEDAIYLGTDAGEKWKRDELKEWSSAFFERESAWTFTPVSREFYFSKNGNTVWFDELLKTWMGTCRGSGVLQKQRDGWKIKHYHLSVTVSNDLIQQFITLVKEDPKNAYLNN